tara:strand:- start:1449 stop:2216 length:768 start_codon:yes stop_codon:yes gene_type:complete
MIIDNIIRAQVVKRPSATCKSPYVADIIVDGSDEIELAHAPSLGCDGMADKGAIVYVTENKNPKAKCKYVIYLSQVKNTIVGIHPKISEKLAHQILKNNKLPMIDEVDELKAEVTIDDSRFDFTCKDKDNTKTIIEVKSVPIVDNQGKSYFPHGFRKKKSDPISPRAIKHINSLRELKITNGDDIRCMNIFIIQRNDTNIFKSSDTDPHYTQAIQEAFDNGVEIIPCSFEWIIDIEEQKAICEFRHIIDYEYACK